MSEVGAKGDGGGEEVAVLRHGGGGKGNGLIDSPLRIANPYIFKKDNFGKMKNYWMYKKNVECAK